MKAHYDNINNYPHPQIVEQRNVKNVIIAGACILAGCILICNSLIFNVKAALTIALSIMGISGISSGIILLLLQSKQKIYIKTRSVIKSPFYYFSREYLLFAQNLLANKNFDCKKTIPFLDNGSVYFHVLSSLDNRFAAVQIFEFDTSSFQPITSIYYFEDEQALEFWKYINRCKSNTKKLKYNLR